MDQQIRLIKVIILLIMSSATKKVKTLRNRGHITMNIMAGTNKITKVSIEVFMLMISMVLSQSNTTTMKMEFIMLMQPLNKLLIQMLGNGT